MGLEDLRQTLQKKKLALNDSEDKCVQSVPPVKSENQLSSWEEVQEMSGVDFEKYCMKLLRLNGFEKVENTVASGDGGVDILARKSGKLYAIQCKRWKGNVGYKAIQEIYAGKALVNADKAVVMTNSRFSGPAKDNAQKLGVILWDGNEVQKMLQTAIIQSHKPSQKTSVLSAVVSAFKEVVH